MERRSSMRFPAHCPIKMTGSQTRGRGSAFNLSVWGCAVQSPRPVQKGERLTLQVRLPGEAAPLQVDFARVRWARESRFGVEFLNMPTQARARLRQLLISLVAQKRAF